MLPECAISPTSVAVDEVCQGGSGDMWVADGYGEHRVHQIRTDGEYVRSIAGEDGPAGAFNCPHAVYIDRRKPDGELYVAETSAES